VRGNGTFEALLCVQVDLLRLSDLFQNLLDNNTIIVSCLTKKELDSNFRRDVWRKFAPWGDLDVKITLNDIYLQLSLARTNKYALIYFELMGSHHQDQLHTKPRGTTFSTAGPNSCLKVAVILVFFPAPEGP
jgi:hypothetical protein